METLYCIYCDKQVSERICFNCNEYKGVVTETEYKELQKEWWGVAK